MKKRRLEGFNTADEQAAYMLKEAGAAIDRIGATIDRISVDATAAGVIIARVLKGAGLSLQNASTACLAVFTVGALRHPGDLRVEVLRDTNNGGCVLRTFAFYKGDIALGEMDISYYGPLDGIAGNDPTLGGGVCLRFNYGCDPRHQN